MKLNVTITKTSTGMADYIQIMSDDQVSVNIVLVAEKIEVKDHRLPEETLIEKINRGAKE